MTDQMDDFLAELDAEISKVTTKSKLKEQQLKLRKKLGNTRDPVRGERRDALKAEYAAVTSQLDAIIWTGEANVALFSVQHCTSCGSTHRIFLQHMQQQVTTSKPLVRRWVRVPKPIAGFPREILSQFTETHICADCVEDFGFSFGKETVAFEDIHEPLTVAKEYVQEDMNEEEEQ